MKHLTILIPVNFSEQSRFAINYAANLNANFEVEVKLLHVLELSAFADVNREGHFEDLMGINTEMLEIQRKAATEELKALREDLEGRFAKVTAHMKLGPLTETILSFSHNRKVDLILMGTKGVENLKAWISGSETQIVARRSEIPVCSVMDDHSGSIIDNVLFISDFRDIDVAPDPLIRAFSAGLGATLHLLYIASSRESDAEQVVNAYAAEHGLENYEVHIHQDNRVEDGIRHFDGMEDMDLIALGTHGRKGINHLIRGSIAENLINHLHKPVLVYRI